MEKIEVIRKEIDGIDNEIIKLLKRRFMLVRKAGNYKKRNGFKRIDRKREQEVLRKTANLAKSLGLNNKTVKEIFNIIIKEGRKIQK